MDRSVFVALSGALMQERRMEALTNNLANISTPGFKRERPVFEVSLPEKGGPRFFVVGRGMKTDMSQGIMEKSESRLNVAIEGDGFFVVQTPQGVRYTRKGDFTLDSNGRLTTTEGFPVLGKNGVIKLTTPDIIIDSEGNIEEAGIPVDRLRIVAFDDSVSLVREGNLFSTPSQDGIIEPAPGVTVLQGYIETSNVNPVKEMVTMIEALRAYETHVKMIQTIDDITRRAINDVGRLT